MGAERVEWNVRHILDKHQIKNILEVTNKQILNIL